jgi:endonuclease YncB( thermonuclease family)
MSRRASLPIGRILRAIPSRWRPWAIVALIALAILGIFFERREPTVRPGERPARQGAWQRLEKCRLVEHSANDGDSVHILWQGHDYIFRLYFVDTPETDKSLRDRIAEQAEYWGITPEQTIALGKRAIEFTADRLGHGRRDLVVQTRWRDALGRSKQGRSYAFIADKDGRDLGEELVREGLARIFGMRTNLPDGSDVGVYLRRLEAAEREAKAARRGAWGLSRARKASRNP